MLYTNRCYQKFEFNAINQIRAKSFTELLKHCVDKRQRQNTCKTAMVETASDLLYLVADSQFRHGYGFPVETFGMSEQSNKYFFIVPKSLYHIFVSGNTRSI